MLNTQEQYINALPNLFQDNPEHGQPRSSGWKTWLGYIREAKQLATCIIRNRSDYRWLISLNIDAILSEQSHKELWNKISRSLRNSQIAMLWVREVSRSNKIHYHIIVPDQPKLETIDGTREVFRKAIPKEWQSVCRVHPEGVCDPHRAACYMTKAKRPDKDIHKHKRILFAKSCKLDKCGAIGQFWKTPKQAIWEQVVQEGKTRTSKNNLLDEAITPDIHDEAKQIHELIDGYYALDHIARCLARHAISVSQVLQVRSPLNEA